MISWYQNPDNNKAGPIDPVLWKWWLDGAFIS